MIITRKERRQRRDRRERVRTDADERETPIALSTPAGADTLPLGGLSCNAEKGGSESVLGDVSVSKIWN